MNLIINLILEYLKRKIRITKKPRCNQASIWLIFNVRMKRSLYLCIQYTSTRITTVNSFSFLTEINEDRNNKGETMNLNSADTYACVFYKIKLSQVYAFCMGSFITHISQSNMPSLLLKYYSLRWRYFQRKFHWENFFIMGSK